VNILYWPNISKKAQYYLRYYWPAQQLSKMGHNVRLKNPDVRDQWTPEMMADDIAWADTIVFFFPHSKTPYKVIDSILALGAEKKIIVDADDYTFAVSPLNPAYVVHGMRNVWVNDKPMWIDGVNFSIKDSYAMHKYLLACMYASSAMTVTTSQLANAYSPFLRSPDRAWVLPNSLNLNAYKMWERKADKDEIRIGWFGGSSHIEDLIMVVEPLNRILEKYKKAKFVWYGQDFPNVRNKFSSDRVEFHPWTDMGAFFGKIGSLDIDIGLCPIVDNDFNKGKSNLKQLEFGVFSVPSVVSKIANGPYNMTRNGIDGMVVDCSDGVEGISDQWFTQMERLVADEGLRRSLGGEFRSVVESCYNIERNSGLWEECYQDCNTGLLENEIPGQSSGNIIGGS
jgi:glycosyltransferase involved in cell wall biosynthesis